MANVELKIIDRKAMRARIIWEHVQRAGYRGCVCFSCGNASAELQRLAPGDMVVLDVSPSGQLQPTNLWWSPEQIHLMWPDLFDATSGHLPMPLMAKYAHRLVRAVSPIVNRHRGNSFEVDTGSGETLAALRMAYPEETFVGRYSNDPATKDDEFAPLRWITYRGDVITPKEQT